VQDIPAKAKWTGYSRTTRPNQTDRRRPNWALVQFDPGRSENSSVRLTMDCRATMIANVIQLHPENLATARCQDRFDDLHDSVLILPSPGLQRKRIVSATPGRMLRRLTRGNRA
jgi:hypothetical protein